MRGIRDYNRKDNASPMTSGMSYSSRSSWRGVGSGARKQTKRNEVHSLHDRTGMTGLVIPIPVKVKPIYTTTHSEASHVATEQSVHSNSPSAVASVLTGSGAQTEEAGYQALRTTCNSSSALGSSVGTELKSGGNLPEGATKSKTRSWLSILTHDIPSPLPVTVESHPSPSQETPSVMTPSSPVHLEDAAEASPAPIPHININAAAPCKPVGRLARRPIGDDSYYRSDADLERDRAQRQAYRDWVAMNEMAKREMIHGQEVARESPQPMISLKKVDRPAGEQLKTPLYLHPGESTATTVFYRQDHGAVELEGEDYQIYMNSKRKWENDQRTLACSMCGEKRDLGVALEMYACLLK